MTGPRVHRNNPQFAQRQGRRVASFELQAGALKYAELAGGAEPIAETVPWSKVPPPFEHLESAETGFTPWVLFAGLAIAWVFVFLNTEQAVFAACLAGIGYLALCAGVWFASSSSIFKRTSFPAGDAVVTILHDSQHREILDGIVIARQTFLRRFAAVDPQLTPAENLRKLRRLVELEAITPHEFEQVQAQLVPGQPSFLPAIDMEPPVVFQQKRLLTECNLSLHRDYFVYDYADLSRRRTRKVRYLRLPSLDHMEPARISAWAAVVLGGWLMLFVCATFLQILNTRPDLQLAGLNGVRVGIPVFGPLVACAALICICAAHFSSIPALRLAELDLVLMDDTRRQAIIDELMARRRAAVKACADDPLLTPAEQKAMLLRLHKAGLLSDVELEENLLETVDRHDFQEPSAADPAFEPEVTVEPGPPSAVHPFPSARTEAQWRRRAASSG